jgi:hypothetical protein
MSFKRVLLVPCLLVLLLSWEAAAQQKVMIFPQFASGGVFRSTIVLQNSTGAAVAATVDFFRADGTPFTLNFTDGMSGASRSVPLGPNQTVFLETDGSGDLSAGWVRVTSSADIGGTVIFSQFDGAGNRVTEAGVGPATPGTELSIPVDVRPGFGTGVALANFGTDTASGTMRLLDTTGTIVANGPLPSLGPRGQTARFVSELFPGVAIAQGTLSIVSSTPLAAVALRTASNILTTLPVTPGAAGAPITPQLGGFRGTMFPGGTPFFLGTFMSGGNVFVNFEAIPLTTCTERAGLFSSPLRGLPALATGVQVSPTGEFSIVSRNTSGEEASNIMGRFISSTRAVGTARFASFTGSGFGQCEPGNYTFDVSFSPDYPQLTQFSTTKISSTQIQISYAGTDTHGDVGSLILRFTDSDNRIRTSLTNQIGTTATGRTSFSLTELVPFTTDLPPYVTGVYAILVDSQGNRSAPLTAMFSASGSKTASDAPPVPMGGAYPFELITVDALPVLIK